MKGNVLETTFEDTMEMLNNSFARKVDAMVSYLQQVLVKIQFIQDVKY